jgi:hypothetical protein
MTKWICQLDSREFDSEESARDAVSEYVDASDFEQVIDNYGSITFDDIIEELQRLDSPLYHKLMEEIHERIFQDYFYEEAVNED